MCYKHLVGITYNVDSLLGLLYAVATEQENYSSGYLTNGVLNYEYVLDALNDDDEPDSYPATVSIYSIYPGCVNVVVEEYITDIKR